MKILLAAPEMRASSTAAEPRGVASTACIAAASTASSDCCVTPPTPPGGAPPRGVCGAAPERLPCTLVRVRVRVGVRAKG